MPATGAIVKEAHLVTESLGVFPNAACNASSGWPTRGRHLIDKHYAASEKTEFYIFKRRESWAPREASEFGQAARCSPLPSNDEAWYVNMNWSPRPSKGTAYLVTHPKTKQTVMVSAGHETGPSSNTAIGGVSEETLHYLGVSHRSTLQLGQLIKAPKDISFGPVRCK